MFQDILETDLLKFQICWNEQIDFFHQFWQSCVYLPLQYTGQNDGQFFGLWTGSPRRSLRILRNWVLEEGGSRSYFQSAQKYERLGGSSTWQSDNLSPPVWLNFWSHQNNSGFWSWKNWMSSRRNSGGDFQKSDQWFMCDPPYDL